MKGVKYKKAVLISIALVGFKCMPAQMHVNFWSKANIWVPVNKHWNAGLELQHRRQSAYNGYNCLYQPLVYSIRTWAEIPLKTGNTVQLSPIAYFWNYPNSNDQRSLVNHASTEWRSAAYYELKKDKQVLEKGLRTGMEFRHLFSLHTRLLRLRIKPMLRYKIGHKTSIFLSDEIFFQMASSKHFSIWDQNRILAGVQLKISTNTKFELGYMWQKRKSISGWATDNNLVLTAVCKWKQ